MRRAWGAVLALALFGCAEVRAPLPTSPVAYGAGIVVDAQAVPLDPRDPANQRIGNFAYAGGLHITSSQTARLHGLSDLKVRADGRMIAESDQSDLFTGRIVLDGAGRLVGVADGHIATLKDEGGDIFRLGPKVYDSEGIAQFANGDLLVSFEQEDRILLFPHTGEPPRAAPMPPGPFVYNKGMEALAADPAAGPDAYRVGLEADGRTFLCRLSASCRPALKIDIGDLELSGFDLLADGRMVVVLRGFSPLKGNTIRVEILDPAGRRLDGMEISRPLTVDNFEGIAAVPGRGGALRLYLVSDDNFGSYDGKPTDQRTLLLAFDWTPAKGN